MIWDYHNSQMINLKKIYQKTSLQTQNRLQEIFDSIDFDFNNLYSIANSKAKKRIDTYIQEWQDKGLLIGNFGALARNIKNRNRVKNNEILELLIYGAYIEEQNKLKEPELNTFKEVANYYYQEGQKEVNKTLSKKKIVSVIPDAIFLALMSMPNSKGYIWNEYIETITKYNADQIYRQATIDLQQQKELDITNDIYQNLIKRQQNSKLNINGDKISGDVDLTLIGINNQAKIKGIYNFDENAKCRFISVEDEVTTKMCHSLNGQEFYIHNWNEFERYSKVNDSIRKYKCYGLVSGLNLPPINDGFHWCRSTIIYQVTVEKEEKTEYNDEVYFHIRTGEFIEKKIDNERQEIINAVRELPEYWQNKIEQDVTFEIIPEDMYSRFSRKTNWVYIRQGADKEEIIHELGHYIETKLNLMQTKEYKEIQDEILQYSYIGNIYGYSKNGNKSWFVRSPYLASEYQGYLNINNRYEAYDKNGKFRYEVMTETFSELVRMYYSKEEKVILKKNNIKMFNYVEKILNEKY